MYASPYSCLKVVLTDPSDNDRHLTCALLHPTHKSGQLYVRISTTYRQNQGIRRAIGRGEDVFSELKEVRRKKECHALMGIVYVL